MLHDTAPSLVSPGQLIKSTNLGLVLFSWLTIQVTEQSQRWGHEMRQMRHKTHVLGRVSF